MNPNAQSYRVRPCFVCGFPFSDEHHIHPEILGRDKSPTIILCPNHHRLAHIVQGMLINSYSESSILGLAEQTFDASFNKTALPLLFSKYEELKQKLLRQLKFDVGDAVMVCIDCDRLKDEHNYRWGIVRRKGVCSSVVYIAVRNRDVELDNQEIGIIDSESSQRLLVQLSGRFTALIELCDKPLDRAALWTLEGMSKEIDQTEIESETLALLEKYYGIKND